MTVAPERPRIYEGTRIPSPIPTLLRVPEELRGSDRFFVDPSLEARWNEELVAIEDLCARGARIGGLSQFNTGASGVLQFKLPSVSDDISIKTQVVWSSVKAVDPIKHRAGLSIAGKADQVRLAIGRLCESGRATIDTHSLTLKLKIIRARARALAPSYPDIDKAGADFFCDPACERDRRGAADDFHAADRFHRRGAGLYESSDVSRPR